MSVLGLFLDEHQLIGLTIARSCSMSFSEAMASSCHISTLKAIGFSLKVVNFQINWRIVLPTLQVKPHLGKFSQFSLTSLETR